MSEQFGKELLKTKTPNKAINLFSTEKLKRKIQNETNKSRKQRRENLFNKQRNSLSPNSSTSPQSNSTNSLNNQISDTLSNQNQSNTILKNVKSNEIIIGSTLPAPSIEQIEQNKLIHDFCVNLQSKYSIFKQTSNSTDLINYIYNENKFAFIICATEFKILSNQYDDLKKFTRDGSFYEINVNQSEYQDLTDFQRATIYIIKLIHEIVNNLIELCNGTSDLKLIESFVDLMLFLCGEGISTLDEETRHFFNLINFFSNQNLEVNHIQIYIKLFDTISCFIDPIDNRSKIWSYFNSRSFLNLIRLHTEFACHLKIVDSTNLTSNYQSNDKSIFNKYLESLFQLSADLSERLMIDTLDVQDDLCKLIENLKDLVNRHESNKQLIIYFVQILNNYFEPYVDFSILDFLFPVNFIEYCCSLVKTNIGYENSRTSCESNKLIENIIALFSNITSMEMFCEMLIDLKFIDQFRNLLMMNNRTVIYYLLIMIKNILSFETDFCIQTTSRFQAINKNSFDLIFTPIFVKELISTIDKMNSDCKTELSVILIDVFKYAKPTVIRSFISLKFIENLSFLIQNETDVNMIFCVFKILSTFINENKCPEQFVKVLNYYETTGIIENVEQLCYNPNSQISEFANLFLDQFYKLSDLKENISPYQ